MFQFKLHALPIICLYCMEYFIFFLGGGASLLATKEHINPDLTHKQLVHFMS